MYHHSWWDALQRPALSDKAVQTVVAFTQTTNHNTNITVHVPYVLRVEVAFRDVVRVGYRFERARSVSAEKASVARSVKFLSTQFLRYIHKQMMLVWPIHHYTKKRTSDATVFRALSSTFISVFIALVPSRLWSGIRLRHALRTYPGRLCIGDDCGYSLGATAKSMRATLDVTAESERLCLQSWTLDDRGIKSIYAKGRWNIT